MSKYFLTIDAELDLVNLRGYYRRKRLTDVSRKIVAEIRKLCRVHADQPYIDDPRDDLGPGLRCGYAGSWLVFYRPVPNGIQVLRIRHSSRDLNPEMFPSAD